MPVCVCVCVRARAQSAVCVCVYIYIYIYIYIYRASDRDFDDFFKNVKSNLYSADQRQTILCGDWDTDLLQDSATLQELQNILFM